MLRWALLEAIQHQAAGSRPQAAKDSIIARRGKQARNIAKGGAEHDLASVRGVAGGDRMALIGSLTAVLDRQPTAVSWATSQLERLRDRAVSALA